MFDLFDGDKTLHSSYAQELIMYINLQFSYRTGTDSSLTSYIYLKLFFITDGAGIGFRGIEKWEIEHGRLAKDQFIFVCLMSIKTVKI